MQFAPQIVTLMGQGCKCDGPETSQPF